MAVIRYHRYIGELWDDLDLEELVDELSDFLLQSGFGHEMEDWDEDSLQALARRDPRGPDAPGPALRRGPARSSWPTRTPSTSSCRRRSSGWCARATCRRSEGQPFHDPTGGGERGAAGPAGPLRAHREGGRLPRLPRPARPARLGGQGLLRPPRHARPRHRRRGLGALEGLGVRRHHEPRRQRHAPARARPRGAQGPARRRLRRPAGAPVRVPVLVRHRGDARLLAQHDPLRRGPLHAGQEGGAGALAPAAHPVPGRQPAPGPLPRLRRGGPAVAARPGPGGAVLHEHPRGPAPGPADPGPRSART